MSDRPIDLLQGTLDMLVLKALTWGPMHGYAVLNWLRERTDNALNVEDGPLYPALHRLEARGLIESHWGVSENNRRAKYYGLTAQGRMTLIEEAKSWKRYVGVVAKIMNTAEQGT